MVRIMSGLTPSTLKKHPSLFPLLCAIGGGAVAASLYVLRLATQNPDVSWNKKTNPMPNQKVTHNEQTKFMAVNIDYKNLPDHRPKIEGLDNYNPESSK